MRNQSPQKSEPIRGQDIPTLGIKHSHLGNKEVPAVGIISHIDRRRLHGKLFFIIALKAGAVSYSNGGAAGP